MPNRLYYLPILLAAGLVEVVGAQAGDRMVERVYGASHRNVGNDLGRGTPQERMLFFSSMIETTRAEISDVIAAQAAPTGSEPPWLSLLRRVVRTSPQGLDQLTRQIAVLVDRIEAEHPGPPGPRLLVALYDGPAAAAAAQPANPIDAG